MERTYMPVEFAIGLILLVALICVRRNMTIAPDGAMQRMAPRYLPTPGQPAAHHSSLGEAHYHHTAVTRP